MKKAAITAGVTFIIVPIAMTPLYLTYQVRDHQVEQNFKNITYFTVSSLTGWKFNDERFCIRIDWLLRPGSGQEWFTGQNYVLVDILFPESGSLCLHDDPQLVTDTTTATVNETSPGDALLEECHSPIAWETKHLEPGIDPEIQCVRHVFIIILRITGRSEDSHAAGHPVLLPGQRVTVRDYGPPDRDTGQAI